MDFFLAARKACYVFLNIDNACQSRLRISVKVKRSLKVVRDYLNVTIRANFVSFHCSNSSQASPRVLEDFIHSFHIKLQGAYKSTTRELIEKTEGGGAVEISKLLARKYD